MIFHSMKNVSAWESTAYINWALSRYTGVPVDAETLGTDASIAAWLVDAVLVRETLVTSVGTFVNVDAVRAQLKEGRRER